MPNLRYALEAGGPKCLELTWEGLYRNFTVKLDNAVIGPVVDAAALAAGHSVTLPDGTTLLLQTEGSRLVNELRVRRDGQPLPASATDPARRVRLAGQLMLVIAGLDLGLGLLAEVLRLDALRQLGFGWGSFILGLLYLGLGLLTLRQRSLAALLMALFLYSLETAFQFLVPLLTGTLPNFLVLIVRALVLFTLAQGIPALRHLRQSEALPAPTRTHP
jgi:hypothetical protein